MAETVSAVSFQLDTVANKPYTANRILSVDAGGSDHEAALANRFGVSDVGLLGWRRPDCSRKAAGGFAHGQRDGISRHWQHLTIDFGGEASVILKTGGGVVHVILGFHDRLAGIS